MKMIDADQAFKPTILFWKSQILLDENVKFLVWKPQIFILKTANFVLKTANFCLKIANFAVKIANFILKPANLSRKPQIILDANRKYKINAFL